MPVELKVVPTSKPAEDFQLRVGDYVWVNTQNYHSGYGECFIRGYGIVLESETSFEGEYIFSRYNILLDGKTCWCFEDELYKVFTGRSSKN